MVNKKRPLTHGHCLNGKRSITYIIWKRMKDRCLRPSDGAFASYGGRGISVCDRWRDSFDAFLEDMGERPAGMQLDRLDNSAGYSPENCAWRTRSAQARNRRDTFFVEYEGRRVALQDLQAIAALPIRAVKKRILKGWPVDRALKEPSLGVARAAQADLVEVRKLRASP